MSYRDKRSTLGESYSIRLENESYSRDIQRDDYTRRRPYKLRTPSILDEYIDFNREVEVGRAFINNRQYVSEQDTLEELKNIPFDPIIPLVNCPIDQVRRELTLSPKLRKMVEYIAQETSFDDTGILMLILNAVTMATWGRFSITINDNWTEPTILMSLQIASAGSRKSSVINKLREPFEAFSNKQKAELEERCATCC